MERIIVGVDGSATARRALRWAAAEAERRDAQLEVVHAYKPPYTRSEERTALRAGALSGLSGVKLEDLERRREEDRRTAHQQVLARIDRALERVGVDESKVRVKRHAVTGVHPETALIELSRGADLLVVGSRGRGAVAGRLLGSVSRAASEHAHCPVVVIPPAVDGDEFGD